MRGLLAAAAVAAAASGGLDAQNRLPAPLEHSLMHHRVPLDNIGLLIRNLDSGEVLLDVNSARQMQPASLVKLLTSYAALEVLGPAWQWPTEVYLLGELRDGELHGDLGIKGHGDPYMMLEDFWRMLRQLRRRGVRKIHGRLVLDDYFFERAREGPGDFDGRPSRVYNLPHRALIVNFQAVQFFMDANGGRPLVQMEPDLPNLQVRNRMSVAPGPCTNLANKVSIDLLPKNRRNLADIGGVLPGDCSGQPMTRTVLQTTGYMHGLFSLLWGELGGEFSGPVVRRRIRGAEPFMTWQSRTLHEVMTRGNKWSNNLISRHILLTMDAQVGGPPASPKRAIRTLGRLLAANGIDTRGMIVENGSGLSRRTRLSARLLSEVLHAASGSRYGAEFMASLPLGGMDGTMRARLEDGDMTGRTRMKTGALDHVSAMAGYVDAASGTRYSLVLMLNHPQIHRGTGKAISDMAVRWLHDNH